MLADAQSCFHCGLVCDQRIASKLRDVTRYFCCYGCQAVTQAIIDGGLGEFYRHRDQHSQKIDANSVDFTPYDLPEVQEEFVVTSAEGHRQAFIAIGGLTCAACVWLIEKHLDRVAGLIQARVNASSHRATLTYDPEQVKLSTILTTLSKIGYQPQPLLDHELEGRWLEGQRQQLMRLGVAGIGMMQSGMVAVALHAGSIQGMEDHWQQLLRWVNMLFTLPILLYSAQPFFLAAWRALKARHLVMDVSVSLALLLAFSASVYATVTVSGDVYFDSVAMFTFFLLLGRYLESRARWKNLQSTAKLRRLLPLTVNRVTDQQQVTIPLRQLNPGDHIWVAPGSVFPCDGTVLSGLGEADEALLTGESMPLSKGPGDKVLAGSHNGATGLKILVDQLGSKTQLAAIERLQADAEDHRPPQVLLADRLASRFVGVVLLIASLTFCFWLWWQPSEALWVALSVLVVTCPCALSLATPTVLTAAVNYLRQHGFLVTAPHSLEALESIDTVVFDKTGTLTCGSIQVTKVVPLAEFTESHIVSIAAALEAASSHPIARAFAHIDFRWQVDQCRVVVGAGVSGVIDGECYRLGLPNFAQPENPLPYPSSGLWLLLADVRRPLGWIKLQDSLRASAPIAINQLADMGLELMLFSGDRTTTVASVAAQLGIKQWAGQMLPVDKLARVKRLQAKGAKVFMLGDGINDLPVLSAAQVSCAMGSGTDLTRTKADCVLLHDDLSKIPMAIALARQARRIIRQNIAWAILYNLLALPLAVCGLVPPWLAAIGMSSSSLIVVINALRVGH